LNIILRLCYNKDVMKKRLTSFFIGFVCLLAVSAGFFLLLSVKSGEAGSENSLENNIRKADEILVKFKDSDKINTVKIAQADDFYEILDYFNNNSETEYAEPNYLYNAAIIPSDTYYKNQWHLIKIKAPEAWDYTRESPEIIIAIVDSGVQISHLDLRDNIWSNKNEIADNGADDDKNGFIDDVNGWDFVNNTADPNPKFSNGFTEAGILHGTIVAGVAAASGNNASGISGVTWRTKLMPLKVLNDSGEGSTDKVIKAIDYAINNGADVINLSFVGFGFSKSLDAAIRRAYESGIIIVAAAGNEQDQGEGYSLDQTPMYPACHDGNNGENMVIGVVATDTLDQKASFSSYGFNCVDIAAPGVNIYSTSVYSPAQSVAGSFFDKYYDGYWSGTSMAAPIVSASVALVEAANPALNRNQVIDILINNADNINRLNPQFLNQLGSGRINLAGSVKEASASLTETTAKLLISPRGNYEAIVKTTGKKGSVEQEFVAYGSNFRGGVNVAAGDVDGDGVDEIITGAGPGGGPHVRIFSADGSVKGQFFAYNQNFRGGVNVAVGDVDGDGVDEIITGAGPGGGPHVRIFSADGNVKGQFFAYSPAFRGGVNVAAGDVDGDGVDEIITGAGPGGGPHVMIFNADGKAEGQFFAYDSAFRGGVNVAVGDVDGGARNKKDEIITGAGPGGGPHVKIFDNYARNLSQFFAYGSTFNGGVNLDSADIDNDGVDEIITGAGPGGAPHVRTFEADGKLISSFYAFEAEFEGGVDVSAIEVRSKK